MNCENVATVLSDRAENKLSAAERCALDIHLASCVDCAHAWHAQRALLAQRVPAASADLLDRALRALDVRSAPRPRRRYSSRLVLGSVLLTGAALATIGITIESRRVAQEERSATSAPAAASGLVRPVAQPAPATAATAATVTNDVEDKVSFPDGDYFVLLRAAPEYPPNALREGRGGRVQVQFTITKYGTVADATVIESSDKEFEATAILAVSRWKFMPRVVNGQRVEVRDVATVIRFELQGPSPPQATRLPEPQVLPREGPPLPELLAPAWNCAAARDWLCAQQVLDEISASYDLLPFEKYQLLAFYGYLYTQYEDYERAIAAYTQAIGAAPGIDTKFDARTPVLHASTISARIGHGRRVSARRRKTHGQCG